jgi:hypothetical protein
MFNPLHFPDSATKITSLKDEFGNTDYEKYPADRYWDEEAFKTEYEAQCKGK